MENLDGVNLPDLGKNTGTLLSTQTFQAMEQEVTSEYFLL